MVLDLDLHTQKDFDADTCDFWDALSPPPK
jgi:hypothetical protein